MDSWTTSLYGSEAKKSEKARKGGELKLMWTEGGLGEGRGGQGSEKLRE